MSILNKTTEELYDFSDVDEETEAELDQEEYMKMFEEATVDFIDNMSPQILKFFHERHPNVGFLYVLKEWIDCGLLQAARVSPDDLIEATIQNIDSYYEPEAEEDEQ